MIPNSTSTNGGHFELRIRGRLGQEGTGWFADMQVVTDATVEPNETLLRGYVQDQAALQGLIRRIGDLGLALISVNRVGGDDMDE